MSIAPTLEGLAVAIERIEQRQAAYEQVAHRQLDIMEVVNEKLDAVLEAATLESDSSPVQELLAEILTALRDQEAALGRLPTELAEAIRGELADDPDVVPAGPAKLPEEDADGRG